MKKAAAAVGMATFYNVSLALPPKTKVFVAIGHFTAPSSNIIDWVTVQHDCPARRVEARYSKDILTLYAEGYWYPLLSVVSLLMLPLRIKFTP